MANEFNQQIVEAVETKNQWYNLTELPRIQDAYRLHLTCVRNIIDALVKKSLINEDPYKKDKKISDIVAPENAKFNDNERPMVLGIRLSDYESMLDYICNYMKFSVEYLNMDKIRKLVTLNNSFAWNNLSPNTTAANTRALALALEALRTGAPQILLSMLKDNLSKSISAITDINKTLKDLANFQKQRYKSDVRKFVLMDAEFKQEAYSSSGALLTEIKRLFPGKMKRPFSQELVTELIAEETGEKKEEMRTLLLNSLNVKKEESVKKEEKIDTKEILMEAVRILGTAGESYEAIAQKIHSNHEVLESTHNSFGDKFKRFMRRLFGTPEPEVIYEIVIEDKATGAKRKEKIKYNECITNVLKKGKYYTSFSVRGTPGFNKVKEMKTEEILDFLNKRFTDSNKDMAMLNGLDEYFKNVVPAQEKAKVKGIKMELTAMKNVLVKANQYRAEYMAYDEERKQMAKLGITNA